VARLADGATFLSGSPVEDVSLQALLTLQSLIKAAPKPTLWQSIFPGVFAGLYRRIISVHCQTSSGLLVSIECEGISTLMDLFRLTMVPLAKSPKKEIKSVTLLLQQLELKARTTKNKADEETVEKPTEDTFLDKVK